MFLTTTVILFMLILNVYDKEYFFTGKEVVSDCGEIMDLMTNYTKLKPFYFLDLNR